MILSGTVWIFTEMAGEPEPVFMEELGAGDCAGWVTAVAKVSGMRAVAKTEVQGLIVMAPAFLEIARYDPALREDMFARVRKGEVWRAVLSEMERRTGGIASAREIVASLFEDCVTKDWPEDEETIATDRERLWIVAGGEGVKSGDRWGMTDGVLWARLIGLPADKLSKALAGEFPKAPDSIRILPTPSAAASSLSKLNAPNTSTTAERAVVEKLPPIVPSLPVPGTAAPRRSIWKALGVTLAITVVTGSAAAFWASKQPVREPFAMSGSLSFVGERRTIMAGISGKVTEWGLKAGSRIERGSIIAILQPPMDEAKAKALDDAVTLARTQADFCEGALAGRPLRMAGGEKYLLDLATELYRLRSEHRVLSAVERGVTNDYTLTAEERQRVNARFASARAEQVDRMSSAARDTGARREELRDAEAELREAQEELNVQVKAYADIGNQKGDEAKQERAAAQRTLGLMRRTVGVKQDVVTRLRKEIAGMSAQEEPAPEPSQEATSSLPGINADMVKVEEQLRRYAETLRRDETTNQAALKKLRADSAPRQIEALQPGLVLEAAPLTIGSIVQSDTVLGRLTTRQGWEVECQIKDADLARLKDGQEFSVITVNADGTTSRLAESLSVVSRAEERPRLKLLSSRDDWRDGTPIRIETTVVTGTLLDSWLEQIRWATGW